MSNLERITHSGANVVIWVLILLGALVSVAVPFLAASLVEAHSEFANDFWGITGLLFLPIVFAESLLVIILVLLRRIRINQIFTATAHKWVLGLSSTAAGLSSSFVVILTWLNIKNTLPPIIGLVLLIGFFAPLAVALVTGALLFVLKRATFASEELEGVV